MEEKKKKDRIAFAIGILVGMILYMLISKIIWPMLFG